MVYCLERQETALKLPFVTEQLSHQKASPKMLLEMRLKVPREGKTGICASPAALPLLHSATGICLAHQILIPWRRSLLLPHSVAHLGQGEGSRFLCTKLITQRHSHPAEQDTIIRPTARCIQSQAPLPLCYSSRAKHENSNRRDHHLLWNYHMSGTLYALAYSPLIIILLNRYHHISR